MKINSGTAIVIAAVILAAAAIAVALIVADAIPTGFRIG